MKIKFISKTKKAHNIISYRFEKPANFNYLAGQYSEFHYSHPHPDNRGLVRWFTLSSAPEEDYLEFTTKHPDSEKSSSFKKSLQTIKKGTELDVYDSMGDFVLPMSQKTKLIFIVAGIGITPLLSIMKHLKITNQKRPIYIYYIARTEEMIDLESYREVVDNIFLYNSSKEFELKAILKLIEDNHFKDYLIYLSGPQLMVEDKATKLKSTLDRSKIILDYFDGY